MPGAVSHPAIESVFARMAQWGERTATHWGGAERSYAALLADCTAWERRLAAAGIGAGTVCALLGDFSPRSCALLLALMRCNAIAVPFTPAVAREIPALSAIAGIEAFIDLNNEGEAAIESREPGGTNPLIARYRETGRPGLVVFTSGSTGEPKGILHDCERVMGKFATARRGWRTVMFLLMDHFGGYNTLLSVLANGGVAVCLEDRNPDEVCRAIAASRADLLPTTPTFLNMLFASGAWRRHDLSSIELITYGTELMPEATLKRVREAFPAATVKQTYGLSELGVLRSDSPDQNSTWLRVGGQGFETKIVDGTLWIRSASNMVGYLNAPDPFDDEGWMNTGDQVEERDGLVRFQGRKSELINVGGQKVLPIEVENVLLEAPNIREAAVYAAPHPLMGQVVAARVSLVEPEEESALTLRLRRYCRERLAKFKVPMRIEIAAGEDMANARYKKSRRAVE